MNHEHIRKLIERDPYNDEAVNRLMEIGSGNDMIWLIERDPYNDEAVDRLMEIGSGSEIIWLIERDPYNDEAVDRLMEIGSGNDMRWLIERDPYNDEAVDRLMKIGLIDDLEWLHERDPYNDEVENAILNYKSPLKKKSPNIPKKIINNSHNKEYDLFISHASEDKPFVKEIVDKLMLNGARVWYDNFTLKLGDSLRSKIDYGLVNSKFGVVVLSKHFISKDWPQKELNALFAMEINGNKVILPIWHNITKEEVLNYSPLIADKLAANSSRESVTEIVERILDVIN